MKLVNERADNASQTGAFRSEAAPNQELQTMDTSHHTVEYEDALVEERLLWKQLEEPSIDVKEQVKAYARWSAAAERARALSERMHRSDEERAAA